MAKVSKRGGFSDRNAIKPENKEIQLKSFDDRTRIQLQNMISALYVEVYGEDVSCWNSNVQEFLKYVIGTIYSEPVDARNACGDDSVWKMINHTILCDEYDDVLTLIEAIIQYWDRYLRADRGYEYYNEYYHKYNEQSVYEVVNECFKKEYIGYRFVDGIIVPISNDYEVKAINEALESKYNSVYNHLSKANRLLADRTKPDYENSIKESISAVEAMSEIITGLKGKDATLGSMLKRLEENGVAIHGGLKSAFNALYGYTSDANGIRHAGDIGGPSSTFDEAKFMLVACSAFINYLTALSADR